MFLSKYFILYANKKKDRKFILKERNTVYLFKRNIKIKKLSNKLNYIKLESCKTLETKKLVNYKLNLLAFMQINLIFFIFLLKSADLNTLI